MSGAERLKVTEEIAEAARAVLERQPVRDRMNVIVVVVEMVRESEGVFEATIRPVPSAGTPDERATVAHVLREVSRATDEDVRGPLPRRRRRIDPSTRRRHH